MKEEIENLPVYKKAKELLELADSIVSVLNESQQKEDIQQQILSNAMLICAKIAGAEGGDIYSLRMENCISIKFAIREMFEAVLFSHLDELNNKDYVQLMRDAIEEFRRLFLGWIRSFDPANDFKDDWGIRFQVDYSDDFDVKMIAPAAGDINPGQLFDFPDMEGPDEE